MVECQNKKCKWVLKVVNTYCSQGFDPDKCEGNEDKVVKDLEEIKKDLTDSKK